MSQKNLSASEIPGAPVPLFAALGDSTRLAIVAKLAATSPRSITQLTEGSKVSRQAITKHLRVLQNAGLVRNVRSGRESLFEFDPASVAEMRRYLDFVSAQWDQALHRLKKFVED
jgi:DNA-binding transcriptional ArsR family regulator